MFKVQEAVEPIMNNYHRLMGIAMIRVASSVNVKAPNPKHRVSGLYIIVLVLFPYLFILKPCVWWWINGKVSIQCYWLVFMDPLSYCFVTNTLFKGNVLYFDDYKPRFDTNKVWMMTKRQVIPWMG